MRISIDVPDDIILALSSQANKERVSIEELICSKLADFDSALQDLSDQEIESKISALQAYAFDHFSPEEEDEMFTVERLTELTFGVSEWKSYSPSTRKKFGRRFRQSCETALDRTRFYKIVFMEKTLTNAALYGVRKVAEDAFVD